MMINFLSEISETIDIVLLKMGVWGPIVSSILIIIESVVPILPLFVFITLNFLKFGPLLGFFISWICTIIGCALAFLIFDRGFDSHFKRRLSNRRAVGKFLAIIEKLKFEQLVVVLAIPWTPAFAVNIAAGLAQVNFKKYLKALIIGKLFLVYFWGFIGTNLVASLKKPIILVQVVILLLLAYIIGKIISQKLDID